jgi:Ser/Thr protein kinase RdoA (MazF antagonist)
VLASPRVSQAQAEEIARQYYGVSGTAERLAAEHDDVFRLTTADGTSRLIKAGAVDPVAAGTSFQTAVLRHLERTAPKLPVQRVIPALDGRAELLLDERRLVRMTTYLEGRPLGWAPASAALRRDIGGMLARLNHALRSFRHPAAIRTHLWDLQNFPRLRPLLDQLPRTGQDQRPALLECFDRFDAVVRPRLPGARKQVIHTDFHGDNLLVDDQATTVTGILDFGDSLAGPVAMDVGVAACYQFGGAPDPLEPSLEVVAGYHAADPLGDGDLPLIGEFMLARLAARIIVSQWNAARDPGNADYLLRRTPQAIEHFGLLRAIPAGVIVNRLAASLEGS